MSMINYRSRFALLLIGLLLACLRPGQSYSSEAKTFFIAAAKGYGVEDCLSEGGECGNVVANAWCEAYGRGAALKFGRSEENAETNPESSIAVSEPYFITCGY
jgi:hypothetical protein